MQPRTKKFIAICWAAVAIAPALGLPNSALAPNHASATTPIATDRQQNEGGVAGAACPPCFGDLTGSGSVGVPDLLTLLACWGPMQPGCECADLTSSGTIGVPDLLVLLGAWGPCPADPLPAIDGLSPLKVGITGQVWLQGANLGDLDSAVVVFDSFIVAADVEHHAPNEIVVHVPFGTVDGFVNVVTGVDGDALREMQVTLDLINGVNQQDYDDLADDLADALAEGTWSNDAAVTIIDAFLNLPAVADPFVQEFDAGPLYVRSQIIVDLHQWPLPPGVGVMPSIDEAAQVAANLNATVAGYLPAINSFALELANPPAAFDDLVAAVDAAKQQPLVADAWMDIAMEPASSIADMDVLYRYLHNSPPAFHGREDVWAMDRIQAPAAWNLINRFLGASYINNTPIWLAMFDTGLDHTHPEFTNGVHSTIDADGNQQFPYTDGDPHATQHGTRVASLIVADNWNVIDPATGDRGMNGLFPDDPFLLNGFFVFRADVPLPGPTVQYYGTAARFAYHIHSAGTFFPSVRVMNISMEARGHPISPPGPQADRVQSALLRLAALVSRFEKRLLIVVAAGNQTREVAEYDLVHDPTWPATMGYHIPASLGHLSNVITVGAIGGPDHHPDPNVRDWALDDQRADFSNFGSPVSIFAPGTDVFTAGGSATGSVQIGGAPYTRSNGTSYAAPLVTGTAALVSVVNPGLKPAEIKQLLIDTALPVVTTDGYGNPYDILTLKAGYAVRKALVDRNVIQDDQPWTGVSKIVTGPHEPYYEGLYLFEIRRGSDGRAEGFALRNIQPPGRQAPTIRHDGRSVAYYHTTGTFPQDFTIREYDFNTGSEVVIEGPHNEINPFPQGQWLGGNSFTLDYSATNHLLWSHGKRPNECDYSHALKVREPGPFVIDHTVVEIDHNGCTHDLNPPFPPLDWEAWSMGRVSWRPNSRVFDFGYDFTSGTGTMIHEMCSDNAGTVPQVWFPNVFFDPWAGGPPVVPAPGCPGPGTTLGPERVAWSQDGRARIGFMPGDVVHTRYYNQAGTQMVEQARVEISDVRWSFWSPDGSEAAILQSVEDPEGTFSNFITIRRDIRDVDDRVPTPLIFMPGHKVWTFSWQW